ncbi:MAG: nitroreductase family protein [Actinomycetota bacterium]
MIDNAVLRGIRQRRSIRNFTSDPVTDEQVEAILEAARWAPSGLNSQPWEFKVVRDPALRAGLGSILKRVTFAWGGMAAAPASIVVAVDQTRDPDHFVEDGAVAAQNMCLAAQSLGLGSAWAGVYAPRKTRNSVETAVSALVGLPPTCRVIAVVPVGVGRHSTTATRRSLAEMTHLDRYTARRQPDPEWSPEPPSDDAREFPMIVKSPSLTESGRIA